MKGCPKEVRNSCDSNRKRVAVSYILLSLFGKNSLLLGNEAAIFSIIFKECVLSNLFF